MSEKSKFGGLIDDSLTKDSRFDSRFTPSFEGFEESKFGGVPETSEDSQLYNEVVEKIPGANYSTMYDPVDIAIEGFAFPAIETSAFLMDLGVRGVIGIADLLGQDKFVLEQNAKIDSGYLPSDIAANIITDARDFLGLEQPVNLEELTKRSEIANAKSMEYLKLLNYYNFSRPILKKIPGIRAIDKAIVDEITKRPVLFTAGEFAGIATETEIAYQGGGEIDQALGGGSAAILTPAKFNYFRRLYQKLTSRELMKEYGQKDFNKASEILQGFATKSTDEIAESIRQYSEGDIPLEIITGDEGFTSLERAIVDDIKTLQLNKRDKDYLIKLADNFSNRGNVKDVADFLRAEQARHALNIEQKIILNQRQGLKQLNELTPDASAEDIQEAVFLSLNKSAQDAQGLEDEVWKAVDLDKSAFQYPNARKAFDDLKKSLGDVKADDMPPKAIEFLSEPGKIKTVGDLYGLYSTLGEFAVIARANKQFNTARVATSLRSAILEDLNKLPDTGAAIMRAKNVSKMVNDKFNKGVVGRILSYTREGSEAIDPTLILQKTYKKGQEGKLTFDQLAQAVGRMGSDEFAPMTFEEFQTMSGFHDFLRTKFVDFATGKGGVIDPDRAALFIENNKQILNSPDYAPLKVQFETARDTADVFRTDIKSLEDLYSHRFGTKGEKSFSKFINASSSNRMKSILSGGNPVGQMEELLMIINTAPLDTFKKTGINKADVVQGVKDSIYEYITSFGTKSGDFELLTVENVLRNPEIKKAIEMVLDPVEMKNIDKFVSELKKFNKYKLTVAKEAGSDITKLSFLQQLMAVSSGIITGKFAMGPGKLMAVSAGKQTMADLLLSLEKGQVVRILNDAMKDPKLLEALMLNKNTYAASGFARKRNFLNKYLLSRGIGGPIEGLSEEKQNQSDEIKRKREAYNLQLKDESESVILNFLGTAVRTVGTTKEAIDELNEQYKDSTIGRLPPEVQYNVDPNILLGRTIRFFSNLRED